MSPVLEEVSDLWAQDPAYSPSRVRVSRHGHAPMVSTAELSRTEIKAAPFRRRSPAPPAPGCGPSGRPAATGRVRYESPVAPR